MQVLRSPVLRYEAHVGVGLQVCVVVVENVVVYGVFVRCVLLQGICAVLIMKTTHMKTTANENNSK